MSTQKRQFFTLYSWTSVRAGRCASVRVRVRGLGVASSHSPEPPSNALNGAKRKVSDEHERQSKQKAKSLYRLLVALYNKRFKALRVLNPTDIMRQELREAVKGKKYSLKARSRQGIFFDLSLTASHRKKGKRMAENQVSISPSSLTFGLWLKRKFLNG